MPVGSRHYNAPWTPGSLTHVITNSKGCAVRPLLFVQCSSSTLPALPIPPGEPAALHPSMPGVALVPPSLADTKEIIALGTNQCLVFILFISHTCMLVFNKYFRCAPRSSPTLDQTPIVNHSTGCQSSHLLTTSRDGDLTASFGSLCTA